MRRRRRPATELESELEAISGKLLRIQEEERAAIARELHDDIGQMLTLLEYRTASIERTASGSDPSVRKELEHLRTQVRQVAENVRGIAHRLHPAILEDLGLAAAFRSLIDQFSRDHSIPATFICRNLPEQISPYVAGALYRIAQEALRNVRKHAGTATVRVGLSGSKKGLRMTIEDSGFGFDPQKQSAGLGLIGMKERVSLIGGALSLRTSEGRGVKITVEAPSIFADQAALQGEQNV